MRQKICLLFALLCAIAQGAWAESYVEQTDNYEVTVTGPKTLRIKVPVYDEDGSDHWVYDGNLKVTWTDGNNTQQTKTILHWGVSNSHDNDDSTLPVTFSTTVGGSIDITQGNSSNHFTLSSSDGNLSRTVYENSDGNTFDIIGDWSVPDDMLGKELTLEWDVKVDGSSSLSHTLSGLSSPNVTLGRIGSISYNSSISAYEIASVDNFKDLAVYVNGSGTYTTGGEETTAHNCSGMTFKLTQSIEGIDTPIGYRASDSDKRPFSGTFFGGGNTIKAQLYWPNSYEGIVGNGLNSTTTIRNCVFAGEIWGLNSSGIVVCGIWGWSEGGTPIIEDGWYTLDGRRLSQKPSRAGVYINKGVKVVIK